MSIATFLFKSMAVGAMLVLARKLFAKPALTKPVSDRSSYDASFEEIDAYIERHMKRLNIPGAALAIVEGDETVHQRGFGRARPGGETPSPQTPFITGSLTKSFTALAVMQLVEAGKIEPDAPVQRYLPWFRVADPQASSQITVRHLLNQTSGLSLISGWLPLTDFDDSPGARERQARALATLTLTRPVGSAFEYSDMNYNLLGLIIEAASGESYEAYIENHIFAPLGMRHSHTTRAEAVQDGLAVGHRYWFAFPIAVPNLPIPRGSVPSGQLICSAGDMSRYLIAHLNEGRYGDVQILSPEGTGELHRPAVAASMMGVPAGQYGMGWFIEEIGQTRVVWHSGIVPDFFAYMALLPEQKKGVTLFFNASHLMMTPVLTEVAVGVATLLAGYQPDPIRYGVIPWALRGLPLIPVLQIVGVAATLRRLRRWRQDPNSRPRRGRTRVLKILLPLIPNLLVALTLIIPCSRLRDFMFLFMPDFSWIALVSGSFAVVWILLRTGLVFCALRKPCCLETRYEHQLIV